MSPEHIFPDAIGPVVANASITVGWAILLTAGLSFVGAGVRVPTPEWGSMIAVGTKNIYTGEWWPSVFPGLALALTAPRIRPSRRGAGPSNRTGPPFAAVSALTGIPQSAG